MAGGALWTIAEDRIIRAAFKAGDDTRAIQGRLRAAGFRRSFAGTEQRIKRLKLVREEGARSAQAEKVRAAQEAQRQARLAWEKANERPRGHLLTEAQIAAIYARCGRYEDAVIRVRRNPPLPTRAPAASGYGSPLSLCVR